LRQGFTRWLKLALNSCSSCLVFLIVELQATTPHRVFKREI
jgi:hypothetical protein